MILVHFFALLFSFLLDALLGDPSFAAHPVRLIGYLVSALEKLLYRKGKKKEEFGRGLLLVLLVIIITGAVTAVLLVLLYNLSVFAGFAAEVLLGYFTLAAKSLRKESMKVEHLLEEGDIPGARRALSMLVSRDTDKLDREGIIKAAVETVAENTTDGVIAPLFYLAAGGPAAAFVYKAVNTMDSMLGYKNTRYEYFGRSAARLDDAVNFIPARLAALIMLLSGKALLLDTDNALKIWLRDRNKTASPNAGQTEAVCAGALRIQLGGKASYFGKEVMRAEIGDPLKALEAEDIEHAGMLMNNSACLFLLTALLIIAVIALFFSF
ncbi:MAG: adenosylcobinamide-phosphate synthase CbiB [Lachnospiraceae bacterium]|nr:adenosylcobinamide-phosphate synthase CbiB [Lachnospiraceae bacterium]